MSQSQEPQAKALQQPSAKEEVTKNLASPGPASTPRVAEPVRQRTKKLKKWLIAAAVVLLGAGAGFFAWWKLTRTDLPEGFAQSNGRIEATEIDVATKFPGRIADELVDEGDYVTAGQVVAHMDIESLQAQRREAKARLGMAKSAVEAARSTLAQHQSEKAAADAVVAQREADFDLATREFDRAQQLLANHAISQCDFDTERSKFYIAKAAISSAKGERRGSRCRHRHGQGARSSRRKRLSNPPRRRSNESRRTSTIVH